MSEPTEESGELHITSETGPWAMVPVWVLEVGLNASELATYIALRSFANQRGTAWPHVKTIAERAGCHPKTAEKAISRLRDLGLLTSAQRRRPDGSIAGCSYHLIDRKPIATREGPRESAGTPPRESAGRSRPIGGSKNTPEEHTRENTPGSAPRASDEPPGWANLVSNGQVGEERPTALGLAEALIESHGPRITVAAPALASLLAPALTNGVPKLKLLNAVARLLADGKKLAPWTLQEYVAMVSHVDRGGVVGW